MLMRLRSKGARLIHPAGGDRPQSLAARGYTTPSRGGARQAEDARARPQGSAHTREADTLTSQGHVAAAAGSICRAQRPVTASGKPPPVAVEKALRPRPLSITTRRVKGYHSVIKSKPQELRGVGAASMAKLTFMVGGPEEEYTAAQELLTCMGANVVYCGQVGSGQAAKICNNMLLAIGMIGTAETMNLGIRLGLDPALLSQVLNMSSGRCWSSDAYNPVPGVMEGVPSANNYQGGFGTTLMAKDLGFAQSSATSTRSPIPLGSLAHQICQMCSRGYANKDFSSVFQFLREEENQ
uniref:3-hydroxyisobutyrate dehydrogenase n=1 Tax=Knipowitschia caucasica TaxID=637954 RepID=A0AAV2K290_KNICA